MNNNTEDIAMQHLRQIEARKARQQKVVENGRGIYNKYTILKTNGEEISPEACLFVLRLDTDEVARTAMRLYADILDAEDINKELSKDIHKCLDWLDHPPECICGGGRDTDVTCPFHDETVVWRHGD